MKQYTVNELRKELKLNGFKKIRQTGDHEIWKGNKKTIALPVRNLRPVIALKIKKELTGWSRSGIV